LAKLAFSASVSEGMRDEGCPLKAGDRVVYRPTIRGRGQGVMTDLAQLVPEGEYVVALIREGKYVVVRGFEDSPGGGLFWTEFAPAS
jgi:hypothetical protein